jgi:hypothetical protein
MNIGEFVLGESYRNISNRMICVEERGLCSGFNMEIFTGGGGVLM